MMTEAIASARVGARPDLLLQFGGRPPDDYRAVVKAIRAPAGE
jgi:hypothetical protein